MPPYSPTKTSSRKRSTAAQMRATRRMSRRGPRERAFKVRGIELASAAVVAGTTRLADLGTQLEAALGQDIAGMKILRVRVYGNVNPTAAGDQRWAGGLFIGSTALDAADVFPATVPDNVTMWTWQVKRHTGQGGNIVASFVDLPVRQVTRGTRRIDSRLGETLWWTEEVVGATQNCAHSFEITVTT